MFESHGCFGKGDEYNMAPALFVTQLKVCDTKNVHCTVDFFNVGGLIVSIVIFDISQKIYCYILHTFNGKNLLHRNPFTQHIFAPKLFYTTKFSHKKKIIFLSLHNDVFTPDTLWTKKSNTFCHQKHSPHVSTDLHKQAILKVQCPTPCIAKKSFLRAPKWGRQIFFLLSVSSFVKLTTMFLRGTLF